MQIDPHVQIYANNQQIYYFDESASSHFADDELLDAHLCWEYALEANNNKDYYHIPISL